jgi:hypothetical protein
MLDELDCDALRLQLVCGEWGLDATADGLGGVGRYAGGTARNERAKDEEKKKRTDTTMEALHHVDSPIIAYRTAVLYREARKDSN